MKNRIRILLIGLLPAVAAAHFLCSSDEGAPGSGTSFVTVLDLIEESRYADLVANRLALDFGTQRDEDLYQEADLRYHAASRGWYSLRREGRGQDCALLLGGCASFTMTVLDPEDSVLTLTGCAPEGGSGETADLRLYLNGTRVGEAKLPRQRELRHYRFSIDADDLVKGDNRFRLEVDRGVNRPLPDLPFPVTLSAIFSSAVLEPVSQPRLDAPLPLVGAARTQPASLVLPSGTRLDYFHLPVAGERLRGAVAAALGPLRATILLTQGDETSVELFSRMLDSASGLARFDIDLTPYGGRPCCLSLQSDPEGASRSRASLRWEAVRVVGDRTGSRSPEPQAKRAVLQEETEVFPGVGNKPDIIVVLLDAASPLFFQSIGGRSIGGREAVTPAVDSLSRDAVVFANAVTPAPYTLPAVGSLLTGQVPDRHGVVQNVTGDGTHMKLPAATPTAASLLKAEGYSTYAVITNPNASGVYGYSVGFDRYEELFEDPLLWNEGVAPGPAIERAETLIREHKNKDKRPFYLYLHLFQPHAPYTPPNAFVTRRTGTYDGPVDGKRAVIDGFKNLGEPALSREDFDHLRNLYAANLAYADSAIGEFLQWLRAEGLYERTLLVVCSDHGESFGGHHSIEHGHHLYEETLRVPLFVKYPGQLHGGRKIDEVVSLTDIPFTLAAAGGADPAALGQDGIDLTARLAGDVSWPDRAFSARSDVFKPSVSLRWRGYQLIFDTLSRNLELYFLPDDPRQMHNLADEERIVAGYLRTGLCRYFEELRATEKGELVRADDDLLHSIRAIGYAGAADVRTGSSGNSLCLPLGRR